MSLIDDLRASAASPTRAGASPHLGTASSAGPTTATTDDRARPDLMPERRSASSAAYATRRPQPLLPAADVPARSAGTPGIERRRRAAHERRSWASAEPFERRGNPTIPARRWGRQSARYLAVAVSRDLVVCIAMPTGLLFALHGVTALQAAWGAGIGLLFVLMIAVGRGYERASLGDGPVEFQAGINAGVLTAATLALLAVGLDVEVPRAIVFGALPLMVLVTIAGRHVARRALHARRRRGEAMMATLVVGDATAVEQVVGDLRSAPSHGYQIAGLCLPSIDDAPPPIGVPVLGALGDIPQVVQDGSFEVVIVAGSELSGQALRRLSWALAPTGAELVVAPGLVEIFGPRVSLEPTAGLSLIHVRHSDSSSIRPIVKRAFDTTASAAALLVLSPLMLAIALAVRLTSPGPALFRQVRVGKGGEEFTMLKFRSMVVDAEARRDVLLGDNEAEGPLFKLTQDPRVTPLGRFLRRHSLDELPQLINVVRGDMALVGPRPPLPREVDQYVEAVRRRLLVKPGATGLWQISGRADLPWDEAVKLDLRYVENWSLALDLIILWRTVSVVLTGHGGR